MTKVVARGKGKHKHKDSRGTTSSGHQLPMRSSEEGRSHAQSVHDGRMLGFSRRWVKRHHGLATSSGALTAGLTIRMVPNCPIVTKVMDQPSTDFGMGTHILTNGHGIG
jgi:hypothetical protein